MKRIAIDGVIGWDVLAGDVREKLDAAKGEDIDLMISSPGGSVCEGLAIYNAIRDFRKDGGKVNARVVGLAASMATYIPLAADTVSIEDNAIWMIHNPWSVVVGDQNAMKKEAEVLEGMACMIASAYVKKTGKDKAEIRECMDAETYLFGEEIKAFGFADAIEAAGDGAEDKEEAVAFARTSLQAMKNTMQTDPERQQMDKAAAMIKEIQGAISPQNPVVDREHTAATAEINNEEVDMTIDILMKEHAEVFAEAVEIGVKKERERRNNLNAQAAVSPENADLQAVVAEAIEKGTEQSDFTLQNKITLAIQTGAKMDGENAPSLKTVVTEESALSAEEKALCKNLGISESEYSEQKEDE
ncbi:MAG: ATP-dependent Clp protease proteolytic subunit [Spirochaetales bacterium]|nr:ATP-dependent Clp protease proteolytic subunit [Spirochaetales bacterium]